MSLWSRRCAPLIFVALTATLAGCGGLLSRPPERQLYRVTAATFFPADLPHVAKQLIVASVDAPAGLDTRRIALSHTPVSLNYYGGAEWTDRVPAMVHDAIVASLENSGAFAAVGSDSLSFQGDYRLETELRDFEAVYDSLGGVPTVRITVLLKLVRLPAQKIVAQTLISEQEAASAKEVPQIVTTFNAVFGRVLERSVVWVAANAALPPSRR